MLRTALFLFLLADTAESVLDSKSVSGATITIPMQKQMVPVKRNNETVSYKSAYFGTIQLGGAANKQEFSVTFDTASGQVIVPSARCRARRACCIGDTT